MTENQFSQWVLERLGMTEEQLPKPRITSMITGVMQTLANRVADHTIDRPSIRELLRKDFSVTTSSGSVALTTPITAAEPLLIEFARGWIVSSVSDLTLGRSAAYSFCVDKSSFNLDKPLGLGYFLVDGTTFSTITTAGSRTASIVYVIHGNYTPTLALLPTSLEDDALAIGCEFVKNNGPQPPEPASAIE